MGGTASRQRQGGQDTGTSAQNTPVDIAIQAKFSGVSLCSFVVADSTHPTVQAKARRKVSSKRRWFRSSAASVSPSQPPAVGQPQSQTQPKGDTTQEAAEMGQAQSATAVLQAASESAINSAVGSRSVSDDSDSSDSSDSEAGNPSSDNTDLPENTDEIMEKLAEADIHSAEPGVSLGIAVNPEPKPRRQVLLVVCVNGTHGFASDWASFKPALAAQFVELLSPHATAKLSSNDTTRTSEGNTLNRNSVPHPLLFALLSKASTGLKTIDGLQIMSSRLTTEIIQWLSRIVLPTLQKQKSQHGYSHDLTLSLVGHSLGGLIARAAIKNLFSSSESSTFTAQGRRNKKTLGGGAVATWLKQVDKNIVNTLSPGSYVSIATPHLGVRRAVKPDSSEWGRNLWAQAVDLTATFMVGLSGREMMLMDRPSGVSLGPRDPEKTVEMSQEKVLRFGSLPPLGQNNNATDSRTDTNSNNCLSIIAANNNNKPTTSRASVRSRSLSSIKSSGMPILVQMAEEDGEYMQALKGFTCTLVAAVDGDMIVPYTSAAICSVNPHPNLENNDTDVKIVSVSGFPSSTTLSFTSDVSSSPLFHATSLTPPEIIPLLTPVNIQTFSPQQGTRHHENEPFPSTPHPAPLKSDAYDEDWIVDSTYDHTIPKNLCTELCKSASSWRRVNIHLSIPNPLHRLQGHPLLIGKPVPLVPRRIVDMGKACGGFVARIIVVDFWERVMMMADERKHEK